MSPTFPPALRCARFRLAFVALAMLLSACGPYRIDIQQGNIVTAEQFAQLRTGLTRDQVRFLLGTPLLTDPFHERRWDYLYRLEQGRTREVTQRRLSLHFGADGKVERIDADDGMKSLPPDATGGARAYDLTPGAGDGKDKRTEEKKQ